MYSMNEGERESASESYMYHKIGVYLQLYCVFVYLMLQSKIQAFLCVSFSSLLFMLAAGSQTRSLRSSSKLTSVFVLMEINKFKFWLRSFTCDYFSCHPTTTMLTQCPLGVTVEQSQMS